jgi:Plasmid pRiA4b ORF-3-like protein
MTTSSPPLSIYQLRIVLRGISPLIWRRVLVHSTTTLGLFAQTLALVH